MKVRIIPHQRASASWNLALEEALFLRAKQDLLDGKEVQPIVKLYSFSKPSVVLGYMQKLSEIDYNFCKEVNVDVTMRTTGGGSVYLGKNDLQYSLILPTDYSKELLRRINTSIVHSLQDVGFSPQLKIQNDHPVIRMDNKSFVFDAERRFKNLLLHHGTTLIDDYDYDYMPRALKATEKEIHNLQSGNLWLKHHSEVREKALIKAFEKNLPEDSSVIKKGFTNEEIKLAEKLHKNFYTNKEAFSDGKKKFGICYLPTTVYNMELYAEKE
ncbi:lipoate--protein ligase family protein [Candidatus Woesearchaeota archaeon]|nr:lipoate--protein ligase family protein [Candidatus Woesearchaeota archaeon]